ncbi:MAG: hypothetical protein DI585_06310 [Pseudomonas fluorescens]|nr:MAG: hypothetical protein DI585_06310 [Pseudomonas fluorescens]
MSFLSKTTLIISCTLMVTTGHAASVVHTNGVSTTGYVLATDLYATTAGVTGNMTVTGTITVHNGINVSNTLSIRNAPATSGQSQLEFLTDATNNKLWQMYARNGQFSDVNQRNDLGFGYYNGSTWRTAWHMDSVTGNIGVNTNSPTMTLDIDGNFITRGTSGGVYIADRNGTSGNAAIYRSSDITRFYDDLGGDRMVINNTNGNVGIGITNPSWGLDVAMGTGTPLRLRNTNSTSGNYWYMGPDSNNTFVLYNHNNAGVYLSNGGTSWSSSSDRRLKKDIHPSPYGLSHILQLEPVTYHWRTVSSTQREQVGLIAQDVQKVLPWLVEDAPDQTIINAQGQTELISDSLGVNYPGLIVPLIQAIKDLEAENSSLRQRLEAIESRLSLTSNP